MKSIVFFDLETDTHGKKVLDMGATNDRDSQFHSNDMVGFSKFLQDAEYLCGHNVFEHDFKYVKSAILQSPVRKFIDTLYLSPLLFPLKPHHDIWKEYKIVSEDEQNNPYLDSVLASKLLDEEVSIFNKLDFKLKSIYYALLHDKREFRDFFKYVDFSSECDCSTLIKEYFKDRICANADVAKYIADYPVELAYSLALINTTESKFVTPYWVSWKFPRVENVIHGLRNSRCIEGCSYCNNTIDPIKALNKYFHYDEFRSYEGEPLQERAVSAAIDGQSLLAIFPTGGGKSLTFQLPALVQGEAVRGLTVVISPLQSLMKDQVDNLDQKGITGAVTINGAIDPIERKKSYDLVEDGSSSLLYISPESLRSKSIESLLLKRNVVRFVIDEAHCFSSWGQDFRVDYLYIGDFIKQYQEKKQLDENIPISCFTATDKQKVIDDIVNYFKGKLSLDLAVFRSGAQRTNLKYYVHNKESAEDKYQYLRRLLDSHNCPTIVYVSRTAKAKELADRLNQDGISGGAVYYHGQMDRQERLDNQDKFMKGECRIIVATTAFGMGVDKDDVGLVVHYDISTSLEDYVQESGRAGRGVGTSAECLVLFEEEDLNKHFILLNQSKLQKNEIQQVWMAIKGVTKLRNTTSQSALEIARKAGWDDTANPREMESRIKTAIAALEEEGFIKRGQNMPRIYANSLLVNSTMEATKIINASPRFVSDKERAEARLLIQSLISAKSRESLDNCEGETRVDYLSDRLGIVKENIIRIINALREEKILADAKDLIAFIKSNGRANTSLSILSEYAQIEKLIIDVISEEEKKINLKELNKMFEESIPTVATKKIRDVLNFYDIKHLIKKANTEIKDLIIAKSNYPTSYLLEKCEQRLHLSNFIIKYLFQKSLENQNRFKKDEVDVEFSCLELKEQYENGTLLGNSCTSDEVDDALFYLSRIGALRLDGAFLVAYNAMKIERIEEVKRQYNKEDYKRLEEFYKNKIQQIHIVGEYAKKMANDEKEALLFVKDYFDLNHDSFLRKYFKGRESEISKNITPKKYKKLFGELSQKQLSIIKDASSKYIVVAAGPGSGKTKVLVHKLASLYMMEDVKHEQMLMLTFSRAAATEFKKRLMSPDMIGNAANFIQISTFHSYCFDLLGRVGTLTDTDTIIERAVASIKSGEIEMNRITKSVLVIDEAQDMSETEFSLVQALMEANDDMRVIAVGDDDQNIYEFRKSDSKYLKSLITDYKATKYELLENYRSGRNIVELANKFVTTLSNRLKETPIKAVRKENGQVFITRYISPNILEPVVKDIMNKDLSGSVCVLTETNDDAATIAGMLNNNGVSARLIQDNNGFNLYNLVEMRYFVDSLDLKDDDYFIDDEIWERAKRKTEQEYSKSTAYYYVKNLIADFEATSKKTKYKTDFLQFIYESKLEDFCKTQNSQIVISTIHKAKGREFDNVFLVLKQTPTTDEKKRLIYVAMTRAINNLYIHCNTNYFEKINASGVVERVDSTMYKESSEMILPISFKGVHLSSFYFLKKDIEELKSGDVLSIKKEQVELADGRKVEKYICFNSLGNKVLQLSDAMNTRLDGFVAKGFIPVSASVRMIVWWKKTDDLGKEYPETKIILPDIKFIRTVNR